MNDSVIKENGNVAIRMEFLNLIIPILKIDRYYPVEFKRIIKENKETIGGKLYFDETLFRDGIGHFI